VEDKPMITPAGASVITPKGQVLFQAPPLKEPDPITRTETIVGKSGQEEVVGITQSGKIKPIGRPAPSKSEKPKPSPGYRWVPGKEGVEEVPITGGPADLKAQTATAGKQRVNDLVAGLRDYYRQLDEAGGITNPEKGALSNLAAGAGSSGVGQAMGRMFGTQTQSIRNSITQQRPLLLNAIKEATGMSAKQMDSNAELKMYLAAATDPTLDVKANMNALDMLEKLFGNQGEGQAPATAAKSAPSAPPVGTLKGGYRFKGGDPASPSSWEKQ
jgi:hypothetical protein